jgi:hypothetical protein
VLLTVGIGFQDVVQDLGGSVHHGAYDKHVQVQDRLRDNGGRRDEHVTGDERAGITFGYAYDGRFCRYDPNPQHAH